MPLTVMLEFPLLKIVTVAPGAPFHLVAGGMPVVDSIRNSRVPPIAQTAATHIAKATRSRSIDHMPLVNRGGRPCGRMMHRYLFRLETRPPTRVGCRDVVFVTRRTPHSPVGAA